VQRPLSGLFQLPQGVHAAFWAHFKRNILGVQEIAKTADAERFCRDALALHARLFRLWHRFRAGPEVRYGSVTRQQLINKSIPLPNGFFTLADRYLDSSDRDVRDLAKAMFQPCENSSSSSKRTEWNPPTTRQNVRSVALSSGVRPASAAEAPTAKSPWHTSSPSLKHAVCRSVTLSTTSTMPSAHTVWHNRPHPSSRLPAPPELLQGKSVRVGAVARVLRVYQILHQLADFFQVALVTFVCCVGCGV
jgi:hypothetical protein